MYLQRPDETTGGSRFLLALSLSTVTALAVAAPLAFKAITVDADAGGQDAGVSEVTETPSTSTTQPAGPQIGPKVRSPQAKLPIGPGLPTDYPSESTTETKSAPTPAATSSPPVITIAPTTTTVASETSSTTETTVDSTSTTESTTSVPASSSTSTPTSTSTSIDLD